MLGADDHAGTARASNRSPLRPSTVVLHPVGTDRSSCAAARLCSARRSSCPGFPRQSSQDAQERLEHLLRWSAAVQIVEIAVLDALAREAALVVVLFVEAHNEPHTLLFEVGNVVLRGQRVVPFDRGRVRVVRPSKGTNKIEQVRSPFSFLKCSYSSMSKLSKSTNLHSIAFRMPRSSPLSTVSVLSSVAAVVSLVFQWQKGNTVTRRRKVFARSAYGACSDFAGRWPLEAPRLCPRAADKGSITRCEKGDKTITTLDTTTDCEFMRALQTGTGTRKCVDVLEGREGLLRRSPQVDQGPRGDEHDAIRSAVRVGGRVVVDHLVLVLWCSEQAVEQLTEAVRLPEVEWAKVEEEVPVDQRVVRREVQRLGRILRLARQRDVVQPPLDDLVRHRPAPRAAGTPREGTRHNCRDEQKSSARRKTMRSVMITVH